MKDLCARLVFYIAAGIGKSSLVHIEPSSQTQVSLYHAAYLLSSMATNSPAILELMRSQLKEEFRYIERSLLLNANIKPTFIIITGISLAQHERRRNCQLLIFSLRTHLSACRVARERFCRASYRISHRNLITYRHNQCTYCTIQCHYVLLTFRGNTHNSGILDTHNNTDRYSSGVNI